jgi:hypothetical protein
LSTCSGNPRLGEHCDFTKEELDFIIDYVLERKFESADRRLLRTSILTKIEELIVFDSFTRETID